MKLRSQHNPTSPGSAKCLPIQSSQQQHSSLRSSCSGQQCSERRLAASRRTFEQDAIPAMNHQIHAPQHWFTSVRVAKHHVARGKQDVGERLGVSPPSCTGRGNSRARRADTQPLAGPMATCRDHKIRFADRFRLIRFREERPQTTPRPRRRCDPGLRPSAASLASPATNHRATPPAALLIRRRSQTPEPAKSASTTNPTSSAAPPH